MEIRYGRKRKSIIKALDKKLEAWLDSITDDEVRKMAEKDVILTGGAIASMLMGERVNDYDLYFRRKSTVIAIAEYYVKEFARLNNDYSPEVREESIENCKGETEERVIIWIQSAGIAGKNPDQVDEDDDPAEEDATKPPFSPVFLSQNAITLTDSVQLVIRFFGDSPEIHRNYDFVHATCAYDYKEGELIIPAEALESMLSRSLVYRGSLYPIASIFRMKKFITRGWRITAAEQLKIMWQISELDLSDMQTMREQLTGVDMAYMMALIDALKNVEKDKLVSPYVNRIIDKIFG